MLIDTGCHALALRIREKQKDDLEYTVIETYDPNNTFFYRIVLEKKYFIRELDYKMLFGTDLGNEGIIFCQISMSAYYQADMQTIISSLTLCGQAIRGALLRQTHSNTTCHDGSRLYYALYVINNFKRRNCNEHLQLINKITESEDLWDIIENSIRIKTLNSVNYYDIITLLCARDLLIKECRRKYNYEITYLTSTANTDTLENHEIALNSRIFCAGLLGIFKTPYAILRVTVNRIGLDTAPKSFLVAATYFIIIYTIILLIETSVVKQLHLKNTAYDTLPVVANAIFAVFFPDIFFYALEKHMQGKMPYSTIFKKGLLRDIEKNKQKINQAKQEVYQAQWKIPF